MYGIFSLLTITMLLHYEISHHWTEMKVMLKALLALTLLIILVMVLKDDKNKN